MIMFVDAFYSTIGIVLAFAIICCVAFAYKWIKGLFIKKWDNLQEEKKKKKNNVTSEEDLYNAMYDVDGSNK